MAKVNIPVIDGTSQSTFQIGDLAGTNQIKLKVVANELDLRNAADSDYVALKTSLLNVTGDDIVMGSGQTFELTLERPSGLTQDMTLVYPDGPGTTGQIIGILSVVGNVVTLGWFSAGSTDQCWTLFEEDVNFGDSSPVALASVPAGSNVVEARVEIETAFDGTANLSIGIAGTTSKFMAAGANWLQADANSVFTNTPGTVATGSIESVIVTYTAGGATAGKARCYVTSAVPL